MGYSAQRGRAEGGRLDVNHVPPGMGEVVGQHPEGAVQERGGAVDTVYIQDTMAPREAAYYLALAKQAGAVAKRARAVKLAGLCGTDNHQGVAARAADVSYCGLEDILAAAAEKGEAPFVLLCDGVEDPHNLGALIRTALLCGVHGVVIPRRGGVSVTPTVMKASAGAAARMPIARVANIGEAVRRLKKENIFVYCADIAGAPLESTDLSGPVAIVAGGEGEGASALVKGLCDGAVRLAMRAPDTGVDSYNVSVATGIVLYEVLRSRG